jgi:hypothetical protein
MRVQGALETPCSPAAYRATHRQDYEATRRCASRHEGMHASSESAHPCAEASDMRVLCVYMWLGLLGQRSLGVPQSGEE